MKPFRAAALTVIITSLAMAAAAQTPPSAGHLMEGGAMPHPAAGTMRHDPVQSGQAAFGAIQEIVTILLADPATDWSKVDIDALRQHLIDMDEVTLRAVVQKASIEHGLRMTVTGDGRTREAIQRMVPAHAQDIQGIYGWTVQVKTLPDGEELTVTGANDADATKIRALGFMGVMTLGAHQMHHLAMAKGELMHMH